MAWWNRVETTASRGHISCQRTISGGSHPRRRYRTVSETKGRLSWEPMGRGLGTFSGLPPSIWVGRGERVATGDNLGLPDLLLNGRKRVYFACRLMNRPTKSAMHLSGYETPSDN